MAVTISEETRQKFRDAYFTDAVIDEIRDTAKSGEVVEAVGKEAFALQSKNFIRARIADIATQGSLVDVVYRVIHETAKLLDAGLTRLQIAELAINATSKADVDDVLRTAQQVKEAETSDEIGSEAMRGLKTQLDALKRRFCPQSTTPSVAASQTPASAHTVC